MSKSNKEKARLHAIKQFKNGEILFSSNLLKLKLKFNHEAYEKAFSKKYGIHFRRTRSSYKRTCSQSIEKTVSKKYKEFLIQILKPLSEKNHIFELTAEINLNLYHDEIIITIYIHYEKYNLCRLEIGKPNNVVPISGKFNLNQFLNDYFVNFRKQRNEYMFLKTVMIRTFKSKKRHINNKKYGYYFQPIFKTKNFYKNTNHYMSYVYDKHEIFDLRLFGVNYDLIKDHFKDIFFIRNNRKDFLMHDIHEFENNLDILKCLNLVKPFDFDIEGLSESDILETHELLHY